MTCSWINYRLLINHTFNLNHVWLMFCLLVVQCYTKSGHIPSYIIHCSSFLNVVTCHCSTSLLWEIFKRMVSSTSPTFNWLSWPFPQWFSGLWPTLRCLIWFQIIGVSSKERRSKTFLPLLLLFLVFISPILLKIWSTFAFLIAS